MQYFESFAVKNCNSVYSELEKISHTYALDLSMVSFDVKDIHTYMRGEKKKDYSLLDKAQAKALLANDEQYLKDDFELRQVYDVIIRCVKENDLAPFVDIEVDSYFHSITLILKAGLVVSQNDEFYNELYEEITRKKIAKGLIIRLFDEYVKQEVDSLKGLISNLNGELKEDKSIHLSKASVFVPDKQASFSFVLQEQWSKTHSHKIDFALYAASNGELIGILHNAQNGVSGRNLKGDYVRYIESEKNKDEKKITFKENEFRKEDKGEFSEFYALSDGYVGFIDNELKITTDFNFAEISLKKSGSLLGGDKKGFAIEVSCADANQDAIGASVVLEAANIKILGSVAENAKIYGKKIEISGQTHQSSEIFGDEVSIEIHKGSVNGAKIHINRLELGRILGDEVFVKEANGGQVEGEVINVENLHAHTKLSTSKLLHIKNISGGDNRVGISPKSSLKNHNEIESINEQTKQNLKQINSILEVLNKDLLRVRKTKPVVEKIKLIMEENKKHNKPNEKNITDSVAQYVILLRRTKYLKDKIVALQTSGKKLNAKLMALDEAAKEAKIQSETPFKDENEAVYEYLFPEGRDIIILNNQKVNLSVDKQTLKLITQAQI